MKTVKFIFLLLMLILPFACNEPPKREVVDSKIPPIGISSLNVKVEIDDYELNNFIRNGLPKEVFKYESPELGLNLLAEETNTTTEIIQRLVTPGYWLNTFKEVSEKYIEAFNCLIKPWKWGQCFREVWRTVLVPITVWVDPVYENIPSEVVQIVDKTIGTNGKLFANGKLDQLEISFSDNGNGLDYSISTILSVDVKVDINQSVLTQNIRLKGLLKCEDIKIKVKSNGTIKLLTNIQPEISNKNIDIKYLSACSNLPIDGINLLEMISPSSVVLGKLVNEIFEKGVNKLINKKLGDAINDYDMSNTLKKFIKDNLKPIPLSKDSNNDKWILPNNLNNIKLSQLHTNNGSLFINLSVENSPELVFSPTLPTFNPSEPNLSLDNDFSNEFKLRAKVNLNYSYIGKELTRIVNEEITKKYLELPNLLKGLKIKCFIQNIEVYPSKEKIVLGFTFYSIKENGKRKKIRGCTYLSGNLQVIRDSIKFKNIDFVVKKTPILQVANIEPLKKVLLTYLNSQAQINIGEEANKIEKLLNNPIANDIFTITPNINLPDTVYNHLNKDNIDLFIDFKGSLSVSFFKKNENIELLSYQDNIDKIKPVALQKNDKKFNLIDVKNQLENDTIFTEEVGLSKHLNKIEEGEIPLIPEQFLQGKIVGDTILFKDSLGVTRFHILKKRNFKQY